MTPLQFVIMLAIAIVILTILTLKFKMHPVMVLFLTATFCIRERNRKHICFHNGIFWLDLRIYRRYDYLRSDHCVRNQ